MKFNEFMLFCLDKMLVSNKFNFRTFLEAFKTVVGTEEKLDVKFFPHLMTVVAKHLMPSKQKPINHLLNDYLGEKTIAVDNKSKCIHIYYLIEESSQLDDQVSSVRDLWPILFFLLFQATMVIFFVNCS